MCVGELFTPICFPVGNGVKQGGILSSPLFNIYMDDLRKKLNRLSIGCSIGNMVVNHMLYADDIVLCTRSANGLQKLLDVVIMIYNLTH